MKLKELLEKIAKDFPINPTDLQGESLRTSKLWINYITIWSEEKLRLEKMHFALKKLLSEKRNYYSGNALPEVYKSNPWNGKTPRTENGLQKLIEADKEVILYKEGQIVQKNKVEILEAALQECKQRGFSIKHAIDMLKFENGA